VEGLVEIEVLVDAAASKGDEAAGLVTEVGGGIAGAGRGVRAIDDRQFAARPRHADDLDRSVGRALPRDVDFLVVVSPLGRAAPVNADRVPRAEIRPPHRADGTVRLAETDIENRGHLPRLQGLDTRLKRGLLAAHATIEEHTQLLQVRNE